MGTASSENIMLVGAGFLIIACIFFLLFSMVFNIQGPLARQRVGQYAEEMEKLAEQGGMENAHTAEAEAGAGISDYSFVWYALLALSIVVTVIGAKLVFESYCLKKSVE